MDATHTLGKFVIPYTPASHNNSAFQGFHAEEFDGMRWVGTRQSADSPSTKYLVFGMGRWACPGRQAAIAGTSLAQSLSMSRAEPKYRDEDADH